jgi:hypothetical protein
MINTIQQPENFQTDDNVWWLIYNPDSLNIVIQPLQCSGKTTSPLTMVVADQIEELDQYIIDNNLIAPPTEPVAN